MPDSFSTFTAFHSEDLTYNHRLVDLQIIPRFSRPTKMNSGMHPAMRPVSKLFERLNLD